MYREISILFGILSVCLFMTIHNNNLNMEGDTYHLSGANLDSNISSIDFTPGERCRWGWFVWWRRWWI